MQTTKLSLLLFFLASSLCARSFERTMTQRIEEAETKLPPAPLGVVVVKDDAVVYRHFFGGATAQHRFYIASDTKSFIALLAKSTLDIDQSLDEALPELKIADSGSLSVRDLLAHRSGIRNEAAGWRTAYSGESTDEELFRILETSSKLQPRIFRYDNLNYVLTAFAIRHASGQEWRGLVGEKIFAPLGMHSTTTEACIPTKSDATMHAAGGICSTLDDMTRWLKMQMNDGALDGKQIFPRAMIRETHAPQIDLDKKFERIHRFAYALGWYLGEYDGELLMHHFGSYPGAWAHVSWMPDRKIGVVVLYADENPLPDSVAFLAYDLLLKKPGAEKQFGEDVASISAQLQKLPMMVKSYAEKLAANASDSQLAVGNIVGQYASDAWGTMLVRDDDGRLSVKNGDRSAPLVHVRGDVYYVQWFSTMAPERVVFSDGSLEWDGRKLAKIAGPR